MLEALRKENKIIVRCITYWIFIIALIVVFAAQYRQAVEADLDQVRERYSSIGAEVPERVMRNATYRLFRDTSNNKYDTYLFGVIPVHKRLNGEDRQKVFDLLEEITGNTIYQVDEKFHRMDLAKIMESEDMTAEQAGDYLRKNYYKKLADEFEPNNRMTRLYQYEDYIPVREGLSYKEFKVLIDEVKAVIGRKTADYENLEHYGAGALTYEEVLSGDEDFAYKGGISQHYAGVFCGYTGVAACLLTVLVAVEAAAGGLLRRKEERKPAELAEQEKRRVWFRFLSVVSMTFLPILLFAITAAYSLSAGVRPFGLTVDYVTFIGYSVVRLLPAVVLAAAAGLFAASYHIRKKKKQKLKLY